jgi:hypothetical protein
MAHPDTSVRYDRSRATALRPDGTAQPDRQGPQLDALRSLPSKRASAARRLSAVSSVLILAGGYVHFCLYRHGYRFIPKIGVSFLLQFTSSAIFAAALLVRRGQVRLGRHSVALLQLTRLSAIGLSVGTLAALGIAHTPGGLFQFHEIGLRPAPQTLIAIGAESLAALLLGVAMLAGRTAVPNQTVTAPVESPSSRAVRDAA